MADAADGLYLFHGHGTDPVAVLRAPSGRRRGPGHRFGGGGAVRRRTTPRPGVGIVPDHPGSSRRPLRDPPDLERAQRRARWPSGDGRSAAAGGIALAHSASAAARKSRSTRLITRSGPAPETGGEECGRHDGGVGVWSLPWRHPDPAGAPAIVTVGVQEHGDGRGPGQADRLLSQLRSQPHVGAHLRQRLRHQPAPGLEHRSVATGPREDAGGARGGRRCLVRGLARCHG